MGRATSNTEQFEGCNDYGNHKIERCQDVIKANLGIAPLKIEMYLNVFYSRLQLVYNAFYVYWWRCKCKKEVFTIFVNVSMLICNRCEMTRTSHVTCMGYKSTGLWNTHSYT